ncbi:hypothetical protein SAMD00023353_4100860 [Rosellinia necatrix]|uniref:Uncharacterized protein n=1 Tax=Rosellinia necatrix TaxID=77044 RepID=A0A1W2TN84_ROSNE|nr:hypothetical protein SAMD00023353_4100860 [Rosellinia necatrix]
MSHLAPQAAIFSPSVARAAASTAKDWAYVDAWLRRQYTNLRQQDADADAAAGPGANAAPARPRTANSSKPQTTSPPPFERNPETLEALLALVAANEEADEERERLAQLEAAALAEVRAAEEDKGRRRKQQQQQQSSQAATAANHDDGDDDDTPVHGDLLAEDLLEALDAGLSKDGLAALDALADVSLSLHTTPSAAPASLSLSPAAYLAHAYVAEQGRAHSAAQLLHRVALLQSHVTAESARLAALLDSLRRAPQYQLPTITNATIASSSTSTTTTTSTSAARVAADVADLERAVKAASAALPGLRRTVADLGAAVGVPAPTVGDLRAAEDAYLVLLARKKELDARVRAFAGLPPDVDAARAELDALRARLRDATDRRDADFEMLVERESPVKAGTNSRRFQ